MKDTVSLLIDPTPFKNERHRTRVVRALIETLKSAPTLVLNPFETHAQNIAYFVEYPLYTSFPEMTITSERADLSDPAWTALYIVNKKIETKYPASPAVAYMCILLVPTEKDAFNDGDTQTVYDAAESIVNQYIKLYKLTPYVHHHDLSERNNTTSGTLTPVLRYELRPKVRSLESDGLMLNMGIANLLTNEQELSPAQLNLLFGGFSMDDWAEFHNSLYRLVKAYDFNCYGDADSAVIFSSSAIEGFLMTMELLIKVREQGYDYDTTYKKTKNKHLTELASTANDLYGLNTNTSSLRTTYGKWHKKCYKQRNNIIHKQDLLNPLQSRPAIDASAELILHIARLVRRRYSKSSDLMYIIESIALGLLSK